MDKDFHYYGTYCAARIAGYDNGRAEDIAFYAQFVDDCTETFINDLRCKDYKTVVTCQTSGEMMKKYLTSVREFTKEELKEVAQIWCPFHFLPGNEGVYSFCGPTEANETFDPETMRLLCLPRGSLFNRTENNLTSKKNPSLAHIGMAMHVLADTWTHQYFAGIPSWWINEVEGAVRNSETKNRIWFLLEGVVYTLAGPRYNSLPYLGHGRMGCLPDEGYRKYLYWPNWWKEPIKKDNVNDFREAMETMVRIMKCTFGHGSEDLSSDDRSDIDEVVKRLTSPKSFDEHCTDMEKYIKDKYGNGKDGLPGKDKYNKRRDSLASRSEKDTLLDEFFKAAADHRKMVVETCNVSILTNGGAGNA